MNKLLLFIALTTLCTSAFSQTQVQQGNVIIDPYIGIPNWANSILYNDQNNTDVSDLITDYKVNGGALSYGGRVEYMVADDFGVGVDINYEVSGYNYNQLGSVYNETTMTWTDVKYNYDYKAKKLRAMFRLNYHFVQNDRVDAYTGFAGGYKHVTRASTSDDPNYISDELNGALVPVAFRLAIGTRIYFSQNIGAHIELGAFGGGLLQFGVTFKVPTYY